MSQTEAFLALVRAGLWEAVDENDLPALQACDLSGANLNDNLFEGLDWGDLIRFAEDQSVLGLVAAGMEKLQAGSLPLTEKLTLLGKCQLIEQQNEAMNLFIAKLVAQMREAGIDVVLVKGQGVAQCYEKPLWRSCGDVDFLLDDENYEKAKAFLKPFSASVDKESSYNKHFGMTIGGYSVELHGNLRCGLTKRMDGVIDEVQGEVCGNGQVRTWMNGNVPVILPAPNEDVVFIFTHFLKHFYKGGLGMRQICDWCRLLWTYLKTIDKSLLSHRLRQMKLVTEWKGFAAFAVEYLGMPKEVMPLYDPADKWTFKAKKILGFILESGNFGHNRDSIRSIKNHHYLIRKALSMNCRIADLSKFIGLFPIDSLRFFPGIMFNGVKSVLRGE